MTKKLRMKLPKKKKKVEMRSIATFEVATIDRRKGGGKMGTIEKR